MHDRIQYDEFNDEDWRTFAHEYTHFLQDISTCHGYLYFFHKSQLFNLVFYYIANNQSSLIELPIRLNETKEENAEAKNTLIEFYEGDSDFFRYHHINEVKEEFDEVTTELVCSDEFNNEKLISINIYYDD